MATDQSLDDLIEALYQSEWEASAAAASALAKIGTAAIPSLLRVLRRYPTSESYLRDDNNHVNPLIHAEDALIQIGTAAVEPLIAALKENNWGVRIGSIWCLGEIRDPRAIPSLIAMTALNDPNITTDVLSALGKMGGEAVEPLIEALNDPKPIIRTKAAFMLGQFYDPIAVKPLIKLLDDPDLETQQQAITALGNIADPRALEPLMAYLEQQNTDDETLAAAILALGNLGDLRAIPACVRLTLAPQRDIRQTAALALAQLDESFMADVVALFATEPRHDLQVWTLVREPPYIQAQARAILAILEGH